MTSLLDNAFWHALTGPQADLARGEGGARRYAPGFAPIVAFEDPARPDFTALARHCAPGEVVYIDGVTQPMPAGWRTDFEATLLRLVWNRAEVRDDPAFATVPLGAAHATQVAGLALLTRPGPFGARMLEAGRYIGVFEEGRLVAMAGDRARAGPYREVSGICTHPDAQGRGLARRLSLRVIAGILACGETPFLHVLATNVRARTLYERMGFRLHCELPARAVARTEAA